MSYNSINGYFYVADVRNIFVEIALKRTKPYEVYTVLSSCFAKDMINAPSIYKNNLSNTLNYLSSDLKNDLVKVRNNISSVGSKAIYSNDIVVSTFGRSLIGFSCSCSGNELCLHWMSNFCYQNVPPNDILLFRPHPSGIEELLIDWKLFGEKISHCIKCPSNMEVNNYIYRYLGESIYQVSFPMLNNNLSIYGNNNNNVIRGIKNQYIRPKEKNDYMRNNYNINNSMASSNYIKNNTEEENLFNSKDEDEGMMELGETDYGEMPQPKTFNNYTPKRVSEGYSHPDPIIESYSLSQVDPPEIETKLKLMEKRSEIIENGLLSNLQLESVYYASQCHESTIDGKYVRGFFIGDGAGVGKGREVAAIIAEQYLRGNRRHLWFSVSNDLLYDSSRDLKDIHFNEINIYSLAKAKYGSLERDNNYGDGILYCTYNNLISTRQNGRNNYNESRFYQILNWCGGAERFEGVIVFDECHRAKNLSINNRGQSSKTGKAVIELQNKLPHAKVVYCSATGVSELKNLCYMSRLGLWGENTPFTNFGSFLKTVEQRGIGALEFFAMELKHLGLYVSRQLSYEGASFECVLADTKELREIYDESVRFWRTLRKEFSEAYTLALKYTQNNINSNGNSNKESESSDDDIGFSLSEFDEEESSIELKQVWCYFWGCCQRFFRFMCIALKVPTVIELAQKELKEGKCIVIGLQSTGEARTKAAMTEQATVREFISAPQGILLELIDKAFPLPPTPESVKEERRQQIIERIEKERENNPRTSTLYKRNKNARLSSFIVDSSDEETNSDDDFDHDNENDNEYNSDKDNNNDSGLSSEELNDIICYECYTDENDSQLLICDRCLKRGCHIYCCNPPLDRIPNSKWYCNICSVIEAEEAAAAEQKRKEEEERRKKYDEELRGVYDRLMAKKNELKKMVEEMKLPPNPLDELIDKLGGPSKVAEMTGRAIHLVRSKIIENDGNVGEVIKMEKRNKDLRRSGSDGDKECSLDEVNLAEKDLFLSAIISEAASSGISLQADKRVRNQRRRVHITLELPWSAEKAIQQLGRTHRSNQSSAPEYKFILTDIGGEKRFAAAVGSRLKVLGAITQGDRLANNAFQLDAFTLDYSLGNEALLDLVGIVKLKDKARRSDCPIKIRITDSTYLPDSSYGSTISQMEEWLEDITLFKNGIPDIFPKTHKKRFINTNAMDKFLNRLLCLEVEKQNLIINFFTDLLEYHTELKKKSGTFDDGISDIQGKNIVFKNKNVVYTDKRTNSITYHYEYEINTGMTWEEAAALKEKNKSGNFYKSKKSWFGYEHYIYAEPYPNQKSDEVILLKQKFHLKGKIYKVYRSNSGCAAKPMSEEELHDKYQLSGISVAEKAWKSSYEKSGKTCLHNGKCLLGVKCQTGKRIRSIHVLAGNIIPIWETVSKKLDEMGNRKQKKLSKADQRLKIVRINTDDSKIYGLRISSSAIDEILFTLKTKQEREDKGLETEKEKEKKGITSSTSTATTTPTTPITPIAPITPITPITPSATTTTAGGGIEVKESKTTKPTAKSKGKGKKKNEDLSVKSENGEEEEEENDDDEDNDVMKSMKELKYSPLGGNDSGYDSSSVTPGSVSDYNNPIKREISKQSSITNYSNKLDCSTSLLPFKNSLRSLYSPSKQIESKSPPKAATKVENVMKKEEDKKKVEEDIVEIEDDVSTGDDEEMKRKRKNSPNEGEASVITKLLKTTPSYIPDSGSLKSVLDEKTKNIKNAIKICPECSTDNRLKAKFCDNCGYRF